MLPDDGSTLLGAVAALCTQYRLAGRHDMARVVEAAFVLPVDGVSFLPDSACHTDVEDLWDRLSSRS